MSLRSSGGLKAMGMAAQDYKEIDRGPRHEVDSRS